VQPARTASPHAKMAAGLNTLTLCERHKLTQADSQVAGRILHSHPARGSIWFGIASEVAAD
jgi:hypothetical protein